MSFTVTELEYPTVQASPAAPLITPDLIGDLPPFAQDSQQIQNVMTVIANELARIDQARRNLMQNWFPSSAVSLLHFFERQLGLPTDSPLISLAQRQQNVMTLMQSLKQSGTGLEWEQNVTALVGNNWTYEEHDPNNSSSPPAYTLLIRIPYIANLGGPAGLTVTPGTSGSLSGTFYWAVTGRTVYGESVPCTPVSATVAAGGDAVLAWTAQQHATSYDVYRGTSASDLLFVANTTTNSYTDTGAATSAQTPPTQDTSGSPQGAVTTKLLRATTPAHIQIQIGFSAGFLIGISQIGVDAL